MKNTFLIILALFVSVLATSQDIGKIRSQYPEAVKSEEISSKLNKELSNINSSSNPVLLAYKGSALTLKAKFVKDRKDKREFFKEGASLIESAVKTDPQNIEIRYIRLSVQENAPKVLKYNKAIQEDKDFILKNYATISSKNLNDIIKNFILSSESFNETEKTGF